MEFSQYQKNFFKESENNGNLMINAVAGSGKTFSLLEFMKRVKGKSIFVAFNKSIASELANKVPSHVTAKTLHSFGLTAIRKAYGYVKVDAKKLQKIMQKYPATMFVDGMTNQEKAILFKHRQMITDLVSIWKSTMIDWNNNEEVVKTADHYGINYDPEILGSARNIMQKSIDAVNWIDFDDMIYMPVANELKLETFDNVFIDECQDLNRCQIELVMGMRKKPNGRIIAVGDPKQSIYGFRGADTDAMPRIKEVLNAKELPLSVCYRCPTSHIELAKELVPYIESAPNAKEGIIEHIDEPNFINAIDKEEEPLVLCRTNAPLISFALKMIKQGKSAHVRGADIGNYLKGIVIGFRAESISDFNDKIDEWENNQLEFLNKRQASASVRQTVIDYADVLRVFAEQSTSPWEISKTIDTLFSDSNKGTIFSSVHKAKGLEAHTVYIIKPSLMPLEFEGQKEWELEQERNIEYVALTRSKNKLVFVNDEE
jgi:superfamily I DNA/RNA helicase